MFKTFPHVPLIALSLVALFFFSNPVLASAQTDIFGGNSPFEKFTKFITGPFSYFIAIILIVVAGFMLAAGNDFGGFARRIPMMLLGIGLIIGATAVVGNLFGESAGAVLTPAEQVQHANR